MFWSGSRDAWFLPCSRLQPQSGGTLCVLRGSQLHIVYIKAPGHPNRTETDSLHVPHTAPESRLTREARRGLLPPLRWRSQGERTGSSWSVPWSLQIWSQFGQSEAASLSEADEEQGRSNVSMCVAIGAVCAVAIHPPGCICVQICLHAPSQTWNPANMPSPDEAVHHSAVSVGLSWPCDLR